MHTSAAYKYRELSSPKQRNLDCSPGCRARSDTDVRVLMKPKSKWRLHLRWQEYLNKLNGPEEANDLNMHCYDFSPRKAIFVEHRVATPEYTIVVLMSRPLCSGQLLSHVVLTIQGAT